MALTKITGEGVGAVDNVTMTSDDPTITMTDSSGTNDIVTLQATSGALIVTARDGSADGEIIFKKTDGSSTDETMRIDNNGGLRVGTSGNLFNLASTERASIKNPGQGNALTLQSTNVTGGFPILYLSSTDTTATQNAIVFQRTGGGVGTITTTASSTAYNTSSDHRLKEAVVDMTGAIDRVKALAPKRFNFIVDPDTTVDGFLAHEAQTVVPEAVHGTHNEVDADGNAVMQGIDQSKLVPLLTAALKESIAKIEALEARVTALENA